jgi:hypothetical protein
MENIKMSYFNTNTIKKKLFKIVSFKKRVIRNKLKKKNE